MRELALVGTGYAGEPVANGARQSTLAGALPSAWGGRGRHVEREAAMVAPPLLCHSTMALHLYGLGFLYKHSQLWISSLPSPQAVSLQPTALFSPGLLSKSQVPVPSPILHWWMHVSGWGMQGCGTDYLCRSHCVLLVTDWLLHFPPIAPKASLLSQLISPPVKGLPWMQEPLLSFSSLPRGAGPFPLPLLFLFSSFVLPSYMGIFLVLLGV